MGLTLKLVTYVNSYSSSIWWSFLKVDNYHCPQKLIFLALYKNKNNIDRQ